MIKRFFELQEKVLGYFKGADIELLKKAYLTAVEAHMGQMRASDEPYITHPLAVAATLAEMKLDEISVAAGLLHDVVEDSSVTIDYIKKEFGEEIGNIVWGVTKISKIPDLDVENAKAETLKKMIIAMTSDVRVILIKLADRMHNIRTLDAFRPDKQRRIAKETLEIYAPIAYRLGMGKIKATLEDSSFPYAYPEEYQKINDEIAGKKVWAIDKLQILQKEIRKILRKYKIRGDIEYRIKREISIFRKIKKQSISLDKVYDFLGLRIITNSIENCYIIMGEIHQKWKHIPSRWRDFINHPKNNGYQSIHTTIIAEIEKKAVMFEIQIRTREMHQIAENGIAAHWKYKEGITFLENDVRLKWFREMIEEHKSNPNPKEFISELKGDLTPNEIYVFTPKGKIISLKSNATPIDFAYAIHTEVGHHCKGAIVNERLTPLKTKLNSGDVVDILTSNNVQPSLDWLKIVSTSKARKKILNFIQKKENLHYIERGKKIWSRILKSYKKKFNLKHTEEELGERIAKLSYPDMDTFFRDLGSNKRILDKKNLKTLFPEIAITKIEPPKKIPKTVSTIHKLINVEGLQDIDVSLARCCSPIKGEKIKGYITKNRGLVIHKENCPNLSHLLPSRQKDVSWNKDEAYSHTVSYTLIADDKPGLLNAISGITADLESNIRNIGMEKISQTTCKVNISFDVSDHKQLNKIIKGFQKIKGVYSIIKKRPTI